MYTIPQKILLLEALQNNWEHYTDDDWFQLIIEYFKKSPSRKLTAAKFLADKFRVTVRDIAKTGLISIFRSKIEELGELAEDEIRQEQELAVAEKEEEKLAAKKARKNRQKRKKDSVVFPGNPYDTLIRLLDKFGAQIVRSKGGHNIWKIPGVDETIAISKTPSDYRATQNALSDVKRVLRNAGLL